MNAILSIDQVYLFTGAAVVAFILMAPIHYVLARYVSAPAIFSISIAYGITDIYFMLQIFGGNRTFLMNFFVVFFLVLYLAGYLGWKAASRTSPE